MADGNLAIEATARGALAQVRHIAEHCEDRETARVIYAELRNLAHKLAKKHQFPAEVREQRRAA